MKSMSKMAKLVMILLIVTIASFAIAGIIFYAQYGGSNFARFESDGLRPGNAVDINEERTQAVGGINKVYISTTSDNINIMKSDSSEIKAHYYGYIASSNKDYRPEFTFTASGDELRINVEYPSNFIPISINSNLKLDVYLPAEYTKNLDVQTTSASVNVDEINKLDSFNCKTTSGSLEAGSVNAGSAKLQASSGSVRISGTYDSFDFRSTSGSFETDGINAKTASLQASSGSIALSGNIDDLSLRTTSGSVKAGQVNSKACKAESSSGSITLKGNPGKVDANTTSGNVNLEYGEYASDITATTSSGSVRIKLPGNAEFHISHKTSSGSSNVDFPVTIDGNTDRHGIVGTVVSDRNTINVTTSSGSLEIIK